MSDIQVAWPAFSDIPALGDDEVHVWFVSLQAKDEFQLHQLRTWLIPAEQERADRFLFEKHRDRFIVGRARQRQLLGLYQKLPPVEVDFQYDGLGKPSFRGSKPGEGLCFNFTNSDQAGMLAVSRDLELGIDLERLRPLQNLEGLAERFFTAAETEEILAAEGQAQRELFFRCWTRKEAYLKAVGKGLTFPLNLVQVSIAANEPACILSINHDAAAAAVWKLQHLDPVGGHFGALAHAGQQQSVKCMHWPG
jgi:4'-phosphopantetheinyl transferase